MHSNHFCLHFFIIIFRATCEDVHLKKLIINFLNLSTTAFSTSVCHIMYTSSYDFRFIGHLYKMKKYKQIQKYFLFTPRSNSYNKLIVICSKYLWMFMSREQRIRELKLNLNPCIWFYGEQLFIAFIYS